MIESIIQALIGFMGNIFSKELILLIISMVPILELRGGLIAASEMLLDLPIQKALPICIIGNLIPIPFILLLITQIFTFLKKSKRIKPLIEKLEKKTLKKRDTIEKCEFWGLVIFVGIPLPGTGAWTGALIASLLGIEHKKVFLAISLGVLLAAGIMSVLSYGVLNAIF